MQLPKSPAFEVPTQMQFQITPQRAQTYPLPRATLPVLQCPTSPPAVRAAHLGEPPQPDADIDFAAMAARQVLARDEDAPDAEPPAE